MAIKTVLTDADVSLFIENMVNTEEKRGDCYRLIEFISAQTGFEARMWGSSIIGFGTYHYKSERSKQEGDWPLISFSPRKAAISLYGLSLAEAQAPLLAKLGKYKQGKGCVYIKKLSDIDLHIFAELMQKSIAITSERFSSEQ